MDIKKLEDMLLSLSAVCADLDPVLKKVSSSGNCNDAQTVLISTGIQELRTIIHNTESLIEEAERDRGWLEDMQDRYTNLQMIAESLKQISENQHIPKLLETKKKTDEASATATTSTAPNNEGTTSKTIPKILYLNDKELDSIPNYMKGRMQLRELNSFIEKFNSTIAVKYGILRKPRKQLTGNDKKQINAFKALETEDTKGCYFCTSDDIRDLANQKFTHSTWAMITILRHCNRIKEIRGRNKVVRYCIN